jgi:hypothetical protein
MASIGIAVFLFISKVFPVVAVEDRPAETAAGS